MEFAASEKLMPRGLSRGTGFPPCGNRHDVSIVTGLDHTDRPLKWAPGLFRPHPQCELAALPSRRCPFTALRALATSPGRRVVTPLHEFGSVQSTHFPSPQTLMRILDVVSVGSAEWKPPRQPTATSRLAIGIAPAPYGRGVHRTTVPEWRVLSAAVSQFIGESIVPCGFHARTSD